MLRDPTRRQVSRDPMVRNIEAGCDPHPVVTLNVVEDAGERRGPPRPADKATMQTDRHHLRLALLALGVDDIEGVLQVGIELIARVETLRCGKPHIVRIACIRDDELGAVRPAHLVGQLGPSGGRHFGPPRMKAPDGGNAYLLRMVRHK